MVEELWTIHVFLFAEEALMKNSVSTLTLQGHMVVLLLESPDRLGQLCAPPAKSWRA